MRHILPLTRMPCESALQQVRMHHSAYVQSSTVISICQLLCIDSMCQLLPPMLILSSAMLQVKTHHSASVCSSTVVFVSWNPKSAAWTGSMHQLLPAMLMALSVMQQIKVHHCASWAGAVHRGGPAV